MVLYKNYWSCPSIIESILRVENSFKPRHEDTIIATYLKCGNTWLKALIFAVTNCSLYDFDNHLLLFCHPQEVVAFIEAPILGNLSYLETL
jgi:estrone sulfotransferase